MAPRVKTVLWKLFHGKLPTFNNLYDLNIGPTLPRNFCKLQTETAQHLLWGCYKSTKCWNIVEKFIGISLNTINNFTGGH